MNWAQKLPGEPQFKSPKKEKRPFRDGKHIKKEVTLDFWIVIILLIKGYFIEFLVSNIFD